MKKTYSKPQIAFDSFQLSESIAAGCGTIANQALNVCGYYDAEAGWYIFAEGITGCEDTPGEGYASICYHVPEESWKLFSS